jgi:dUTP pyrophosphatase
MILNDKAIGNLIKLRGLIQEYIDLDTQLQPNGFDVTVKEIYKLKGNGVIDFGNEKRKLPDKELIEWDDEGKVRLNRGVYIVKINEVVNIPENMCALVFPRSSLLRMGCNFQTAVWDAGYNGRGELLLEVFNPVIVYRNARVGQMIFLKLVDVVERKYDGKYQGKM